MVDSEHQNKIAKILDATVMLIQGRSMDETLAFLKSLKFDVLKIFNLSSKIFLSSANFSDKAA